MCTTGSLALDNMNHTPTLAKLADLAHDYQLADALPIVTTRMRNLLLDTLGCSIAGRHHDAVQKACVAAQALGMDAQVMGLGSLRRLSLMGAMLESGAAIRALDFNDFYWGPGIGGHPSDLFGIALPLAQSQSSTLGELLEATLVGYGLYLRLLDVMAPHGAFDHTTAMTLGSAAISARLFKADRNKMLQTLSMALVRGPAMCAMRQGAISEAKATAPAVAGISGYLAAQLAMAGLNGPVAAVMGKNGLQAFVAEGADLSDLIRQPLLDQHLDAVSIKRYPCIGTAQATVSAAQALHAPLQEAASPIESVQVHLGDSPLIRHQCSSAYLHPHDRETADHSFFSLIAMTLLEGTLTPDQFDRRRYLDADVKALSERLHFHFDLAGAEQGLFSARIEVRLGNGKSLRSQALHPPGHPLRPLSADELSRKFLDCALPHMGQERAQGLLENCLQAPLHTPISTVLKPLQN